MTDQTPESDRDRLNILIELTRRSAALVERDLSELKERISKVDLMLRGNGTPGHVTTLAILKSDQDAILQRLNGTDKEIAAVRAASAKFEEKLGERIFQYSKVLLPWIIAALAAYYGISREDAAKMVPQQLPAAAIEKAP